MTFRMSNDIELDYTYVVICYESMIIIFRDSQIVWFFFFLCVSRDVQVKTRVNKVGL